MPSHQTVRTMASVRNTAIKRIQGDVREMMTNPSDQYAASPLETNMFDWHFTLRGPRDTEFEGGIYHGRILLPSDYPFKPPNIMLLTPNGRFEVRKKICLSISAYHPEEWQPAWGEALISFMPTKGEGAIGALDFSAEERRKMAKQSVDFHCDVCGKVADLLPPLNADNDSTTVNKYAEQIAQLHMHSIDGDSKADTKANEKSVPGEKAAEQKEMKPSTTEPATETPSSSSTGADATSSDESPTTAGEVNARDPSERPPSSGPPAGLRAAEAAELPVDTTAQANVVATRGNDSLDTLLHYLTIALAVALFAMVYKKLLQMQGILQ
ncbi:TPA: hypothetical protein N0F65_001389 [Lagenidium giganteum]|uniref:UBC core domain-containing protein n=1 Tax=Lagenidium giganteum TaxID=4803 RepID=A0AAV2Z249_9STRA|nr:TPA: hypothetical protein N0F65_001389 [Lagenidium giganteum]